MHTRIHTEYCTQNVHTEFAQNTFNAHRIAHTQNTQNTYRIQTEYTTITDRICTENTQIKEHTDNTLQ